MKNRDELIRRMLEMLADMFLAESVDRTRALVTKFSKELEREQSANRR